MTGTADFNTNQTLVVHRFGKRAQVQANDCGLQPVAGFFSNVV
jgi:hypothetical protein